MIVNNNIIILKFFANIIITFFKISFYDLFFLIILMIFVNFIFKTNFNLFINIIKSKILNYFFKRMKKFLFFY
jgi:hypothetical protein